MLPLDRLFDGVPDIVFFVKDAQGRYMAVNDTLAIRCGLPNKEALIGLTVEQLFPTPPGAAYSSQDQRILATGIPLRDYLELHLYPSGRRGWCLTLKEPVISKNGDIVGICGISRDLHAEGEQHGEYAALSNAIDHIHQHFHEPLRLPALAEMAGLSVYQFDQRIRSLFHVTAGQFLVKVRVEAACQRLSLTDMPISKIAENCGYSDQSAFSRQFKQVVGLSPLGYRKKMEERATL